MNDDGGVTERVRELEAERDRLEASVEGTRALAERLKHLAQARAVAEDARLKLQAALTAPVDVPNLVGFRGGDRRGFTFAARWVSLAWAAVLAMNEEFSSGAARALCGAAIVSGVLLTRFAASRVFTWRAAPRRPPAPALEDGRHARDHLEALQVRVRKLHEALQGGAVPDTTEMRARLEVLEAQVAAAEGQRRALEARLQHRAATGPESWWAGFGLATLLVLASPLSAVMAGRGPWVLPGVLAVVSAGFHVLEAHRRARLRSA